MLCSGKPSFTEWPAFVQILLDLAIVAVGFVQNCPIQLGGEKLVFTKSDFNYCFQPEVEISVIINLSIGLCPVQKLTLRETFLNVNEPLYCLKFSAWKTTALVVTQAETEDPNSAYFKHLPSFTKVFTFLIIKLYIVFSMFKIVGVFAETSFFSHNIRLRLWQKSVFHLRLGLKA